MFSVCLAAPNMFRRLQVSLLASIGSKILGLRAEPVPPVLDDAVAIDAFLSLLLYLLEVEFAKQHAEDVGDGFIKEYERAEGKTRKSLKNSARVSDGHLVALAAFEVLAVYFPSGNHSSARYSISGRGTALLCHNTGELAARAVLSRRPFAANIYADDYRMPDGSSSLLQ